MSESTTKKTTTSAYSLFLCCIHWPLNTCNYRKLQSLTVRQQECDHPERERLQALVFSVTRPTFAYNKTTFIGWHRVGYFLHAPRRSNTPVPTATTSSSGDSQASKAISFLGRQKICISGFLLAPMHIKNKIQQGKLNCIIIDGTELRYSWTSVSHSRF